MRCSEVEQKAAMYFSHELESGESTDFLTHLKLCASCAEAVEKQGELDNLVRSSILDQRLETRSLEMRILEGIEKAPAIERWIWLRRNIRVVALAAGVLFVLGLLSLLPIQRVNLALYADAAVDHRVEVVNKAVIRWTSNPEDLSRMSMRVAGEVVRPQALSPDAYHFSRARVCSLQGKRYLHLVYTDGIHELSLFVSRQDRGRLSELASRFGRKEVNAESVTDISVASFHNKKLIFLVVAEQPKDAVYSLAKQVSKRA